LSRAIPKSCRLGKWDWPGLDSAWASFPGRSHPRRSTLEWPWRSPRGVAFHGADDCAEVVVVLDRERLEPALPDVTGVVQLAADVSGREPVHPAPEVAVGVVSRPLAKATPYAF
jgi:hypothetical protein